MGSESIAHEAELSMTYFASYYVNSFVQTKVIERYRFPQQFLLKCCLLQSYICGKPDVVHKNCIGMETFFLSVTCH